MLAASGALLYGSANSNKARDGHLGVAFSNTADVCAAGRRRYWRANTLLLWTHCWGGGMIQRSQSALGTWLRSSWMQAAQGEPASALSRYLWDWMFQRFQ